MLISMILLVGPGLALRPMAGDYENEHFVMSNDELYHTNKLLIHVAGISA